MERFNTQKESLNSDDNWSFEVNTRTTIKYLETYRSAFCMEAREQNRTRNEMKVANACGSRKAEMVLYNR